MVQEQIWQSISGRLAAFEPELAAEIIAKAQHVEPTRRAKETFQELTGRWPTPLDEPLLQTARVLVEEHLAADYREALEALGLEATGVQEPGEGNPPEVALPESSLSKQEAGVEAKGEEEAMAKGVVDEGRPTATRDRAQQNRWQQAYRVVFGEDPSREPERYRERLEKAILLYDPAKGRRWAFEQVKAAEERLYASRRRAEEILSLADLVPTAPFGNELEERRSGDLYIHIGRLTAQVEELARRLDTLEGRLNREATRYGGLKSSILRFRAELTTLKEGLEGLKSHQQAVKEVVEGMAQLRKELFAQPESAKVSESALRTLKGEILAEVEERIHLATDLWRGEVEPRLKALEEWAKRITEAFRRTLDAKGRGKGLFGLLGGKTWKE